MKCKFVDHPTDPTKLRCKRCKLEIPARLRGQDIQSECHKFNALRRLKNFTVALIAHVCDGMPTCDQATIDARLAVCKGCSLFRDGVCHHEKCGCNVNDQSKFLNKLAWADQSCPDGKWGGEERAES